MSFLNQFLLKYTTCVRMGHATNSSSSHSILFVGRENVQQAVANYDVAEAGKIDFGWEWFAVAAREEKLRYLWVNLVQQVENLIQPPYRPGWPSVLGSYQPQLNTAEKAQRFASYALEWTPILEVVCKTCSVAVFQASGDWFHQEGYPDGYETHDAEPEYLTGSIDHDSAFSFPLGDAAGLERGAYPHIGFIRWFRDRILDEGVVIFGGNDNEDPRPIGVANIDVNMLPGQALLCVERPAGVPHFLLFDPKSGLKLRLRKDLAIDKLLKNDDVPFAEFPELIDVKITDQCNYGCAFCYQGSTPEGKHADLTYPTQQLIAGLQPREVAIGGGEPLEHPQFWDFVNVVSQHANVNVTTRRLDLLPSWKLERLSGVGYSVDNPITMLTALRKTGLTSEWQDRALKVELREPGAYEALCRRGIAEKRNPQDLYTAFDNPWHRRLVFHVILGIAKPESFLAMLRIAKIVHLPVLLLGYKNDGRGAEYANSTWVHDDWIDLVAGAFMYDGTLWDGPRLGVDTAIVDRWGSEIQKKLRVDPRLMASPEGAFSMYLDLVEGSVSRSSYGKGKIASAKWDKPRTSYEGAGQTLNFVLNQFRSWHS